MGRARRGCLREMDMGQDVVEFNRLVTRGLTPNVALQVMAGELDEEFEVASWKTRDEARTWAANPENREIKLVPLWDCDPSMFYLSMDGRLPTSFEASELTLVEADVADVTSHLQFLSSRSEGPWEARYESKTGGIAYRWAHGLSVTPTLVSLVGSKVTIQGGMHRFHLARHHEAARIPLLIRTSELEQLLSILKSAKGLG